MAWSNNIFYIIFLSQILLLSYFLPRKLLGRMRHVLETYPPAEYPKLYPRPVEHYRIAHWAFKIACRCVLALGLVLLFSIMFLVDHSTFADDGFISEAFPAAYGLIQFLPLMVLELSEFSHLKLMRKTNTSPKRRADLHRRRLGDVVSPKLLGLALFLLLACIAYDFYVHDFVVSWNHDSVQRSIVLVITNSLLAAVGAFQLYGRRLDPHLSSEDRARRTAVAVKSMLYVSMAMSVFFMTVAADDLYDLDFIDAILVSVYLQAIALLSLGSVLHNFKTEDINFDVYKSDTAVT